MWLILALDFNNGLEVMQESSYFCNFSVMELIILTIFLVPFALPSFYIAYRLLVARFFGTIFNKHFFCYFSYQGEASSLESLFTNFENHNLKIYCLGIKMPFMIALTVKLMFENFNEADLELACDIWRILINLEIPNIFMIMILSIPFRYWSFDSSNSFCCTFHN